jgi:DUF177 domain-containing protein
VRVSKTYGPEELDYHDANFVQVGDLKASALAQLAGLEIHIRGGLETRVRTRCDRCLGEVELPVETDFDLVYRPMRTIAREEEIEVRPDELGVAFYSGDGVDFNEMLTEQVNLFMPMKVVCGPDCLGLCPACGVNRNLELCHCSEEHLQSPFAQLLE